MNKYSVDNIRKEFLKFFETKDHLIEHSFSLVPKDDKSLLIINAGMAPLKKFFTGVEKPPKKRMTTCQKCVRTGDIENVGYTSRHATFFEMLGNFSFGDYFKEQAISWAWEFLTEVMEIPEEKLWVSVYKDDDEAYTLWKEKIGIDKSRIVKLGKEDNFWELEVGPSGPCSEIYYDRGDKYGCSNPECKPGCDCDRYVEVWNLVFTQYNKDKNGNYNPLPNPNIDTGMGLERIATVLQGKESIFDIAPMSDIIKEIEKITGAKYNADSQNDISIRIICDHVRAVTFMICDGIIPSNEGRGYVLRRLLRRASRHGKLLGVNDNFINTLSKLVIKYWKKTYPELIEKESYIEKIINLEEDRFKKTIDQGLEILNKEIKNNSEKNTSILKSEIVFKLYDTYGFPVELTEEILSEKNIVFDKKEFYQLMEEQRQRARVARENVGSSTWTGSNIILNEQSTLFVGYDEISCKSEILNIIVSNEENGIINESEEGIVILEKTPFYAECGGQKGDAGYLTNSEVEAEVIDTIKGNNNIFIHKVRVKKGKLKKGDIITASVDLQKRLKYSKNHTATHILHKVLKDVLGEHVNQAGSLVDISRLRFDFTHFESIKRKTLEEIEKRVNEIIFKDIQVETSILPLEEAKKSGATALFDEKYGDSVRIVKIGDESKEFCGGTHIDSTSKIGLFKIISEGGIASGVRRIEAVTGIDAYEFLNDSNKIVENLMHNMKAGREDIIAKLDTIKSELKQKEKEIQILKNKLIKDELNNLTEAYENVNGIRLFLHKFNGMDANSLRETADSIKNKNKSCVILLASDNNNKVLFVSSVTNDLIEKGMHAGNIVKEAAKITGGGGGGRPNFAQAGGKDPKKIEEAFIKVKEIIGKQ